MDLSDAALSPRVCCTCIREVKQDTAIEFTFGSSSGMS